ncbi:MAG: protein transport protein S31 [Bathelium mastoideum]|nr:MAG: protein transport protein S31 [Bathelium mastoideum]
MVRLREIPRTSTFAWCPGSGLPLIATGTRAGAVDADFSSKTELELWDLGLEKTAQSGDLEPVASIATDSRFHDIAWSQPNDDHEQGIIAGALENGSLDLWDAERLKSNSDDAFISRSTKHTGAIKCLQFNPFRHELLATAGAKGELYISDVTDLDKGFRLGAGAARAEDIDCLDWNKKVPHIMATGSSGGFVTVWDVKGKKESVTLNNYGRKAVSAIAWDPDYPTKLATAIPNDQDPLILMWDLRNSNAPEKILKGHDQGVLSLSWCREDTDLLLSCGKDNRTICWNARTGQAFGEFPIVTNWTFETRWHPHHSYLLATASFDGKISIQTIQNTKPEVAATPNNPALDGEDFFANAPKQPQGASFSLPKPPKWLQPPGGVSFGFGGKVLKFGPQEEGSRKSKISIEVVAVDSSIGEATEQFEKSLAEGQLNTLCETKIASAKSDEEKADWKVIETLISGNSRTKLVEYLGFEKFVDELSEKTRDLNVNGTDGDAQANGTIQPKDDGGSAFFDNAGNADSDSFLADLAATKGAKTNSPFQIYTGSESDADKNITQALIMGSFEKALDICLKENRMSDAFMIAICGGQDCIDKAQAAYLKKKSQGPNYLRLLASIVGKNLWDVVHNADLKNWKEVMATLCTFADEAEFPDLCEALGDRLEEAMSEKQDVKGLRRDASFCFLAGSKLEKVVAIWTQELEESEKAGLEETTDGSSFSVHAKALQDFIEKVTIFRQVTKYQDPDQKKASDWKLAPLYAKYTEYADIVAAHGQLGIAEKYLDLLPDQYPAARTAKERVKQATKKPGTASRQMAQANRATPRAPAMTTSGFQPTSAPQIAPKSGGPYTPATTTPAAGNNPYAPPNAPGYPQPGYSQPGYQQPQMGSQYGMPPPNQFGYGGPAAPAGIPPPPPPGTAPAQTLPPPPKAGAAANWNDLPSDFGSKPPTRRSTPSVAPALINAPFSGQPPSIMSPPMPPSGPPSGQRSPPPPPPPKAGQAPTIPSAGPPSTMQAPARPSSSAANAYAPPQQAFQAQQPSQGIPPPVQPPIARGPSPYNPPPPNTTGAPSSNRYAPAPGATSSQPPTGMAPPPQQRPPVSNPYAPSQSPYAPQQQQQKPSPYGHAPPQQASQAQQTPPPPPQGPPRAAAGPPPGGPPRNTASPAQAPPASQQTRASPAPPRYPPGDRSHIPAASQPIYQILDADIQRVKAKAPALYRKEVLDTEKRLSLLFDHLNNEDLLKADTVEQLVRLSRAVEARDYEQAQQLLMALMKAKLESEGGNWMVGVKRLIAMSKVTPVG